MPRKCYTAVIERNVWWRENFVTEPYEVGWASEALLFVRVLEAKGDAHAAVRVQISPDGMHWCDEGTHLSVHADTELQFARAQQFGNWLRLSGRVSEGTGLKVIAYLVLKE